MLCLLMISSKSVSTCNRSHARQVNSGEINNDILGVPLFYALVQAESLHLAAQNFGLKKNYILHGENPKFLSHLGLVRYRVVTDGRTDRITIDSTRLALRAVTRRNEYQIIRFNTFITLFNLIMSLLHFFINSSILKVTNLTYILLFTHL